MGLTLTAVDFAQADDDYPSPGVTTNTHSVVIPADVAPGDILVLGLQSYATTSGSWTITITDPAGFTRVATVAPTFSTTNSQLTVWARIAQAGDAGATVTVTETTNPSTATAIGMHLMLAHFTANGTASLGVNLKSATQGNTLTGAGPYTPGTYAMSQASGDLIVVWGYNEHWGNPPQDPAIVPPAGTVHDSAEHTVNGWIGFQLLHNVSGAVAPGSLGYTNRSNTNFCMAIYLEFVGAGIPARPSALVGRCGVGAQ